MAERDTILAVLQSDIAIAGLVLVFAGFLVSKAAEFDPKYGDRFKWLAVTGMLPVVVSLISAWLCIDAVEGSTWCANNALPSLKLVLFLTGVYAIIAAAISFFP